jgi:murein DD-endopeptidase MepM/ murein hydrolase activator NlpD
MKLIKTSIFFLLSSLYPVQSVSLASDYNHTYPGGIIAKEISHKEYEQDLFLNGNRLVRWRNDDNFYLIYGIPYDTETGQNNFKVTDKDYKILKNININVKDKEFKIQKIKVNKKYVEPSKKSIEKIKKDKFKLTNARKIWLNNNPDLDFIPPAKGIITGVFGTKRFYNGIEGRYHNGYDIAADIGTPILAPSSGKIILTGDFFFNGKTIYLDHGRGLKSIMIHLNEIFVKDNDYVKKGQIIGTIGTTGKSTGPHLHWSVLMNNTYVDPEMLLNKRIINNLNLEGS